MKTLGHCTISIHKIVIEGCYNRARTGYIVDRYAIITDPRLGEVWSAEADSGLTPAILDALGLDAEELALETARQMGYTSFDVKTYYGLATMRWPERQQPGHFTQSISEREFDFYAFGLGQHFGDALAFMRERIEPQLQLRRELPLEA